MTTYAGQQKRVSLVLDVGGVATNGTLSGVLAAPDGTDSTLTITNDSTGHYHSDFTVDQEGRWFVRTVSTGAVVAAWEGYIDVAESVFVGSVAP